MNIKLPTITWGPAHTAAARALVWALATLFCTWSAFDNLKRGDNTAAILQSLLAVVYLALFTTDVASALAQAGKTASRDQGKEDASAGMVSTATHKNLAGHLAILPPLSQAAYARALAIAGTATHMEDAALYQGILSYLNAVGTFSPNPTQADDFAISVALAHIQPGDLIAIRMTAWGEEAHRAARLHASKYALEGMLKLYPDCKGVILGPDMDIETVRAPEVPTTLKALQRLVADTREG